MDLEITREHLMLQDSARDFIKKEHSFDRLREFKKESPLKYSRKVWEKMAKLDWLGLIYPEKYNGTEMDLSYAMVLLEEFGRGMLPEPWISTVLLGGNLILSGGSEEQKENFLPAIASGKLLMTLAYLEEGGRYDPNFCAAGTRKSGKEFSISGKKIFVIDGSAADKFVVSARTSGAVYDREGITLFIIDKNADGVTITPVKTMDGRYAAIIDLDEVSVTEGDVIGEVDYGYNLMSDAIDQATAGLCAEMIGGMKTTLKLTVRHLSDRIQFGKHLGSFQALQHKSADMFINQELATSAVYYAVASIVEKSAERVSAVAIAKAKCSQAYIENTKTAIQLFGAFGFTSEADIGFFFKRAKVAEILFGDCDYNYDRYIKLNRPLL
ncbi:MAG: acyl-CoA dehydrogenase family protein [Deltaproteobacteria bacterium]|nr:acyl-CoA dehydrogenase family protein [Deltaproteobacteria bacterium]